MKHLRLILILVLADLLLVNSAMAYDIESNGSYGYTDETGEVTFYQYLGSVDGEHQVASFRKEGSTEYVTVLSCVEPCQFYTWRHFKGQSHLKTKHYKRELGLLQTEVLEDARLGRLKQNVFNGSHYWVDENNAVTVKPIKPSE
jgi:hypothetical protein